MYYIGIDLGTSSVKLLLMNDMGDVVATASRSYEVDYPQPGWSQQDPRDWWAAACDGMPELLAGIDAAQVHAVACAGQMHGLVALDAAGEVIRPCILWNDGRTEHEVAYLNEKIGRARLSALTGNIAFAGFTAPKLLWLREYEPENFARIAHVMLPKDYLVWKMTGAFATDVSDASGTLLLDVEHRSWSAEMLEVCGVDPAWLPALHESYEAVGTLGPDAASELGLPAGVVVAAGAGDNAAAAVGCGVVGAGACNISLGTSGTVFIPSDVFGVDPCNALHSFDHADGGYHLMGCVLSAASCSAWFMNEILHTDDYAAEERGLEQKAPVLSDPYFLPYLMGERSPLNDALARGAFIGLRADTSRADMIRAVREGVAFAIRDCVEVARAQGVAPAKSTICGGGTRSELMRQMLADVLDMELELPLTEQGPGYGAAMLAMVACGDAESVGACARDLVRMKGSVVPDAVRAAAYDARYRVWRELYPALKPTFHAMGA